MRNIKYLAILALLNTIMFSCASKVPYVKNMEEKYDLTPEKLKKVQFYTSETIILERSETGSEVSTTGKSGELVTSKSSSSERIIIPASVPCILEKIDDKGTVEIRFEGGAGRVLRFAEVSNLSNGRFYLVAEWSSNRGELDYGGSVYYAVRGSKSAYLMVKIKNWQKNKRKDRVVKGMKVK